MIYLVIVYDIPKNKTRRLIGNLLEGYGLRVNRSVFECRLKHQKERTKLEEEILKIINPATDSVRIYQIHQNALQNATALGEEPPPFKSDAVYFF